MPRAVANKLYNNFIRGLITEASLLTFPENATTDELNTVIYRKGNRSRRFGFNYETDYTLSPFSDSTLTNAINEYRWESVGNDATINFLVTQNGASLHFYDLSVTPLSLGLKSFTVNLNDFKIANITDVGIYSVSIVGGKGYLFVAGEKIEPFYVTYDKDADDITTKQIYISIRDFKGVEDNLANDEEPTSLSNEHKYNLLNQGWFNPVNDGTSGDTVEYYDSYGNQSTYIASDTKPIDDYHTVTSRYPGNNKQWWVAKTTVDHGAYTVGDFEPALLEKTYYGSTRAPRGHFITNAFYVDRSSVSGITGLPVEVTIERPAAVSFVGGRTWYVCNSTVYASQVLDDVKKAGNCYQEADPTSEMISDLVATDGVVIPIPEMAKGIALLPVGSGILVFAQNGVWFISGTQAGFTATDITVSKVSKYGTQNPNSVVEDSTGRVFYWSEIGIQSLSPKTGMFGPVEGVFDKANITEKTIQTLYNQIFEVNQKEIKGIYDPATNVIQWLYKSSTDLPTSTYDSILNYDVTLEAFYPWKVSGSDNYICGVFATPTINIVEDPLTSSSSVRNGYIKYHVISSTGNTAFGLFHDRNFIDWTTNSYSSYLESGYELLQDTMRKKQAVVVFCYFRKTETTLVDDGDDMSVLNPSSCLLQTKWDWSDSNISGKWSTKVQAYRHRRLPVFEDGAEFNTGFPIVISRNKVRGSGKSIQFRFENTESGSDFDLLGWAVSFAGNSVP